MKLTAPFSTSALLALGLILVTEALGGTDQRSGALTRLPDPSRVGQRPSIRPECASLELSLDIEDELSTLAVPDPEPAPCLPLLTEMRCHASDSAIGLHTYALAF